jgi:hypothetical protein
MEEDAPGRRERAGAAAGAGLSTGSDWPDDEDPILRPWKAGLRIAEREIASGQPLGAWRHPELEEALRGAA